MGLLGLHRPGHMQPYGARIQVQRWWGTGRIGEGDFAMACTASITMLAGGVDEDRVGNWHVGDDARRRSVSDFP
jgi:hypothetical protein